MADETSNSDGRPLIAHINVKLALLVFPVS